MYCKLINNITATKHRINILSSLKNCYQPGSWQSIVLRHRIYIAGVKLIELKDLL
jgi:hypothetical protein